MLLRSGPGSSNEVHIDRRTFLLMVSYGLLLTSDCLGLLFQSFGTSGECRDGNHGPLRILSHIMDPDVVVVHATDKGVHVSTKGSEGRLHLFNDNPGAGVSPVRLAATGIIRVPA